MDQPDSIRELALLLAELNASPRLATERVARSILYDVDYHIAVVSSVFAIHARRVFVGGGRRILAPWMKMLQFVAARPRLVEGLRAWMPVRTTNDLASWARMPRGYMGDRTHDRIVDLLVATGALTKDGDELVDGPMSTFLDRTFLLISNAGLFAKERKVLEALRDLEPVKRKLGGS